MEDENRLKLSLAPPSNGGATAATAKTGTFPDVRSDINDRDAKLINEFKHFLDGGMASQMIPEISIGNTSNTPLDKETSKNLNIGGFWITNDGDSEGNEEIREKRKNTFGETSHQQKKHEKETDHNDWHNKSRASSHISINTSDDDSTAEYEDVADSDATTSRPVRKDFHGISHPNDTEFQGTKRFLLSSEKGFKLENAPQGVQFPVQVQPTNFTSTTHSNPAGKNIRPMWSQQGLASNLSAVVEYPPVVFPALDKSNSMKQVSQHDQQMNQSYVEKGQLNTDKHNEGVKMTQDTSSGIPPNPSEFTQHDMKTVDHASSSVKKQAEGLSTTHIEDILKGITTTSRTDHVFPSEYQTIKPGIATDLKFGGCGSYPNLPWVSTTGSGPNRRTISGVTYRYSPTQIRIVCACHGTHLTPEEFVQHANEEERINQDVNGGVVMPVATSPPASAKS